MNPQRPSKKVAWNKGQIVGQRPFRENAHFYLLQPLRLAVFLPQSEGANHTSREMQSDEGEEEEIVAIADEDAAKNREFVFVKGHTPSKEGKSRRSFSAKTSLR